MMNLFAKLEKYKTTSKVTPEENFFTEALSYVLNQNKSLLARILLPSGIKLGKSYQIRTQYHVPPNSIIDMLVESADCKYCIEIKLSADLNNYENDIGDTVDQLEKYSYHLNDNDCVILLAYNSDIERIKENKYNFPVTLISWEFVYEILKIQVQKSEVLVQFLGFMKNKSMTNFEGLEMDYFKSMGMNESINIKSYDSIKKQFKNLCEAILLKLQNKDLNWTLYIYSYDSVKERQYCHLQNSTKNEMQLNINVDTTLSELGVSIWIPYWRMGTSDKNSEQGKVNSKLICKFLDRYQLQQNKFTSELMRLLNSVKSTFILSLHVKQYEHLKTSKRKAQGMQKGYDVELIRVNKGNTLIPSKDDNTLMLDVSKEIYDDTKTPTRINSISQSQISAFASLLFDTDKEFSGMRKFIMLKKSFPTSYVMKRETAILKDIARVVDDFQHIILGLSSMARENPSNRQ